MTLPDEVYDLVGFVPLEDVAQKALRLQFSEVPVQTLISATQTFPFILVRRGDDWGRWQGDSRFVTSGLLQVQTFAEGLNADEDAALLGEAVRVALYASVNIALPDAGHITRVDPISLPHRMADWASATGPVQYADLPNGVVRYESTYEVAYRRPIT